MRGNNWKTAKCKICRREIIVRDDYAFKILNGKDHSIYFCSWKHLQEYRGKNHRHTKERGLKWGEKVGRP